MKIITLEEHFSNAAIEEATRRRSPDQRPGPTGGSDSDPLVARLGDLGEQRLRHMDTTGIDMQVVSYTTPGTQMLPPTEAVPLAREANDQLAAAIAAHPDRLAGFATLPTPNPDAAARELERAVQALGFKGAMINGRAGAHYLDDPMFRPLLEAAVALDVPLYLHPIAPPPAVREAYYGGFDPAVSALFATAGWGWHLETGVHALRLILAGVFDRYPTLRLILGHWGEMIPFYLARTDALVSPVATRLQRPIADYFTEHFYVTPSGMFTLPPFLLTLQIVGADRIMYAVDYPYVPDQQARAFLETAPISPADKEKIAHLNAEKLLKLTP